MANGFVRVEFVQRSKGQNMCLKSAYISRSRIHFQGHKFQEEKIYNWSYLEKPVYREVLLPNHAHEKFRDAEFLWNFCEKFEIRKNSQPGIEKVLALPDDRVITEEDRIVLLKTFVEKNFVSKGFGCEVAIHKPEKKQGKDHNWHAHVLLTTRRFTESGDMLEKNKPRECLADIKNTVWHELWTQHQNEYFEEKGLSLRVDPIGVIPQKHLGPVRMRGDSVSLQMENEARQGLNLVESKEPAKILDVLLKSQSMFVPRDLDRFLHRYVPEEEVVSVREEFWKNPEIVELLDQNSGERTFKYTAKKIIDEETRILRSANAIQEKQAIAVKEGSAAPYAEKLNEEQRAAFYGIVQGNRLGCIDGYAGTGKSFLLSELHDYYRSEGVEVKAFGPDNGTAKVLSNKGLENAENVYKFLFYLRAEKRSIKKGREVWIVDESGKLGNKPLGELLKKAQKYDVQLVFSGSTGQMRSVERGGFFTIFCEKYGAERLTNIQRQKVENERETTRAIAEGDVTRALYKLYANEGVHWSRDRKEAVQELISRWSEDQKHFPLSSTLIMARTNEEVRALNLLARQTLKERGKIEDEEFQCETRQGKVLISVGDRIEFRGNDSRLKVENGMTGTLKYASAGEFVVDLDGQWKNKEVKFDPRSYQAFQLGYASTYYRSQGETVERAYVLHSLGMEKEEFYVAITRHVRKAHFFVSREQSKSLSHLTWSLGRSTDTAIQIDGDESQRQLGFSTTQFTTQGEVDRKEQEEERSKSLDQLIHSDKVSDQLRGYGLTVWGAIRKGGERFRGKRGEWAESSDFYNPKIEKEQHKTEVIRVVESSEEGSQKEVQQKLFSPLSILESRSSWIRLSEKEKNAIQTYYSNCDKVTLLKEIVNREGEIGGTDERCTASFQKWQEACGKRNSVARELVREVPHANLGQHLGRGSLEKVIEFSERSLKESERRGKERLFSMESATVSHGKLQELALTLDTLGEEVNSGINQKDRKGEWKTKNQKISYVEVEKTFTDNAERILDHLFSEGPSRKEQHKFRYGRKGSLCVNISGERAGVFYNFETEEKGGLIKLIQTTNGLTTKEAIEWGSHVLGGFEVQQFPRARQKSRSSNHRKEKWMAIRPKGEAPAELRAISRWHSEKYREEARYPYKDRDGNLLFYTLRLRDKEDGSKVVLPLSYGFNEKRSETSFWRFKQYSGKDRPVYRQEKIRENPTLPILVVEGEKAADAAALLFDDMVCVSWSGGAKAVSKTDWSALEGRGVSIWPDNDDAGFKASEELAQELRERGVCRLKIVKKERLAKAFPEKWDLADALPEGKTQRDLEDILILSHDKAVDPTQMLLYLSESNIEDPIQKKWANELLWRVDKRLRGELEEEHGEGMDQVNLEILKKASKIMLDLPDVAEKIKEELGETEQISQCLAFNRALRLAEGGFEPGPQLLERERELIQEKLSNEEMSKETVEISDNTMTQRCLEELRTSNCLMNESAELSLFREEMQRVKEQSKVMEHGRENQHELEHESEF